jgi:hypothetical protein
MYMRENIRVRASKKPAQTSISYLESICSDTRDISIPKLGLRIKISLDS